MPRTIFAPILGLLAACGSPTPENAAPEKVETPPAANAAAPAPVPPPTPLAVVKPVPGELKTFGNWTVGCDNLGACKAVSLTPQDGGGADWPAFMPAIQRDGDTLRITVSGQESPRPPLRFLVDGKAVATSNAAEGSLTGDAARRVAEALAAGKSARIESGGKGSAVSVAGASAALRYMDDRGGHAGSAAALVAKGDGPDRATARAMPVVRIPALKGDVPKLTATQIEAMRTASGCEYYGDVNRGDPELYPLGGGRSLAMLPCGAGAYNEITAVMIVHDGKAAPARFDADSGIIGEDGAAPTVVNASYENGIISSWAKGRGLGDCGIAQRFAWDGDRFRLIEQGEMRECRESQELITTWRARVER